MSAKVSILVPIYNVSTYIEKCANSLFSQTFTDIEYIFVNDATPDDSIEKLQKVIEKYPNRKENITIIQHAENRGLAVARNTAKYAANGDYVLVVDSDDYIEEQMVEILYKKAITDNADIVISDIFIETKNGTVIFNDYLSDNKQDHFVDIMKNNKSSPSLCNKLIKRTLYILDECSVPANLNYFEDRHVIIRLFYFADKIVKLNQPFYHYIQYNPESITKTKTRMHFENIVMFWLLLDNFLKENGLFEKYKKNLELARVQNKVSLLIETNSTTLRREFATIFFDEETNCIKHFKRGEKLMLLLVRYKMFLIAQLFHIYLVIKNRKYRNG